MLDMMRAILGMRARLVDNPKNGVDAVEDAVLPSAIARFNGVAPGRRHLRGGNKKRASQRVLFRAPTGWRPVLTFDSQNKVIAEHWERD